MDVDLDAVHVRETGMTAPELLMSESQERMMAFVSPNRVDEVLAVAAKWEIDGVVVGTVRPGGTLTVRHGGEVVAEVPAASLADDAPRYDRPLARPEWLDRLWEAPARRLEESPDRILLRLLDDPALGSTAWVYEQYDHMLFLNTIIGPGGDASLLRIRGTDKALAVSTDGNGRLCRLDPRRGAARLLFEAALNVAVTGARPLAVVDNLNFGNPEKPTVMWQFRESVEGISEACEALGIPVVGGNVSFYNESEGEDIHPTPVIGLLGLADPVPQRPPHLSRAADGMEIWEIGPMPTGNLAGTSAQRVIHGDLTGRPTAADPAMASRIVGLAAELAHQIPVLHDVSDGGLALAVAEVCITSNVGAAITDVATDLLFSEDPHRLLAVFESGSVTLPDDVSRLVGRMGGETLTLAGSEPIPLTTLRRVHDQAIPRRMSN
jgi:phosphoribosylformylglycinamidine synthase